GMVDRAEGVAAVLDRLDGPVHLEPVDLEAQRAGRDVRGLVDRDRGAVADGDHAAALVRKVAPGVRDDALEERPVDPHYSVLRAGRSSSSSRRGSSSPLRDSLNSRMPLPIERPTSGSFFGPSTI